MAVVVVPYVVAARARVCLCVCVCVCVGVIDRAREATRDRATHVIVCALPAAGLMAAVVDAPISRSPLSCSERGARRCDFHACWVSTRLPVALDYAWKPYTRGGPGRTSHMRTFMCRTKALAP